LLEKLFDSLLGFRARRYPDLADDLADVSALHRIGKVARLLHAGYRSGTSVLPQLVSPQNHGWSSAICRTMRKSDVGCPECQAGYRRIELTSKRGQGGEFKCLVCGRVLEVLDGSTDVAYRLTVQPSKIAW
jgi:hypothetical protein